MAGTGLLLTGFLVAHLLGNLQIYLGPEWINSYAQHLKDWPLVVFPLRGALLLTLLLHLVTALMLAFQNKAARPVGYAARRTVQASVASRTLLATGPVILLFTVYHLLHFTWGAAHPEVFHLTDAKGRHDIYSMVILSFQNGIISSVYVAALLVLSVHVGHGASSFVQTLGLTPRGGAKAFRLAGKLIGWLIFFGYASIPLCSLAGWLKPMQGIS